MCFVAKACLAYASFVNLRRLAWPLVDVVRTQTVGIVQYVAQWVCRIMMYYYIVPFCCIVPLSLFPSLFPPRGSKHHQKKMAPIFIQKCTFSSTFSTVGAIWAHQCYTPKHAIHKNKPRKWVLGGNNHFF